MKYYRSLLLFILTISLNAYAFQPNVEIMEQFDDLKMVAFISAEDMQKNPDWNPNLDVPPLTITEAIQAVRSFSESLKPIREIEIRRVPNYKNKWHYLIKTTDKSMVSAYDIYVVLMNGKVIPGIIEPQAYK